jgi:hypothetical protein
MRLDTFQKLYEIEREWKYKLDDVILIPIAILTGVGSIVSYIVSIHPLTTNWFGYTSVGIVVLTVSSILLSLIFYALSYVNVRNWKKGYDYSHPTACTDINQYRIELISEGKTEDEADKEVDNFLIEVFSDCRDDNAKINYTRTQNVGYGRLFLLISVFLTFIISIMFIFNTMKFQDIVLAKKPKTTVKVTEGAIQVGKTLLNGQKPKPDSSGK